VCGGRGGYDSYGDGHIAALSAPLSSAKHGTTLSCWRDSADAALGRWDAALGPAAADVPVGGSASPVRWLYSRSELLSSRQDLFNSLLAADIYWHAVVVKSPFSRTQPLCLVLSW